MGNKVTSNFLSLQEVKKVGSAGGWPPCRGHRGFFSLNIPRARG